MLLIHTRKLIIIVDNRSIIKHKIKFIVSKLQIFCGITEMRFFFSYPISTRQGWSPEFQLNYITIKLCNTAQLQIIRPYYYFEIKKNFTFIHGYIKAVLDIEIEIEIDDKCSISQSTFKVHDHFIFCIAILLSLNFKQKKKSSRSKPFFPYIQVQYNLSITIYLTVRHDMKIDIIFNCCKDIKSVVL